MDLVSPGDHRRPAHAMANVEQTAKRCVDPLFLIPDHSLNRTQACTAVLLRPLETGKAALGLLFLPGFRSKDRVLTRDAAMSEARLKQFRVEMARCVRVDPFPRAPSKVRLCWGVAEIHVNSPQLGAKSRSRDTIRSIRRSSHVQSEPTARLSALERR